MDKQLTENVVPRYRRVNLVVRDRLFGKQDHPAHDNCIRVHVASVKVTLFHPAAHNTCEITRMAGHELYIDGIINEFVKVYERPRPKAERIVEKYYAVEFYRSDTELVLFDDPKEPKLGWVAVVEYPFMTHCSVEEAMKTHELHKWHLQYGVSFSEFRERPIQ